MAKRAAAEKSGKSLVIVESPAKARTISKFLGSNFTVEASIGHVRDLPQGASQIPDEYRKEPWSRLGVNVAEDFAPLYIVPPSKTAQVRKLKGLLKDAKDLYLATDEDREGEAISWHLNELLKPRCRSTGSSFTKSLRKPSPRPWRTPGRSTKTWFARKKRGASSTGSTATRCRRCYGKRCDPSYRRAACKASPYD